MNSNRNNNRRRGRGSNRGGSGGGGNQSNRIDSRARGNAPQMLDKYKKLAHEASLNDDRVQTEYYLQFADHYFRVIADIKAQKEEAQAKRNAERGQDSSDDDDDDDDDTNDDRGNRSQDRQKGRRGSSNRNRRDNDDDFEEGHEGRAGDQEDDDNPFVKSDKPKKVRKPAVRKRKTGGDDTQSDAAVDNDGALNPDMLPPAIARGSQDDEDDSDEKPRRKATRSRRKQSDDDDGGEALEAVN